MALGCGVIGGAAAPARAADAAGEDKSAVEDILGILKKRGDIDDEEYQRLVTKNAKHAEKKDEAWFDRISFYGDLRGRYEGFWFDGDPLGRSFSDRHRARYRARLGMTAQVNDYVNAILRITSGENDNRSENQTLGRGVDFGPDSVFFDWAYLQLHTKAGQLPVEGGVATLQVGKMPNPFLWKNGQDAMLWDPDITPEGVSFQLTGRPLDALRLFFNSGYFVIDEKQGLTGTARDPYLLGAQIGAELTPISDLSLGSRLSWYEFGSLDASFVQRGRASVRGGNGATDGAGNLADGLSGDTQGGSISVGELGAYATWKGLEGWPATLYGGISKNWSAERSRTFAGVGAEDVGWNAGAEIGDKAKWLKLGVTFFHVEANAFPSQFIDSDILDGITNREAWLFYASRQIFHNTDLNFWVSSAEAIERSRPGLDASLSGSKRVRARADLEVKF